MRSVVEERGESDTGSRRERGERHREPEREGRATQGAGERDRSGGESDIGSRGERRGGQGQ